MFRRKPAEFPGVEAFEKFRSGIGATAKSAASQEIDLQEPLVPSTGLVRLVSREAYEQYLANQAAEYDATLATVTDIDSVRDAG